MPVINDKEFGKITVRRSPRSTQLRVRVAPDGRLRASIPMYAPLFLVRRLIASSRDELREMLHKAYQVAEYYNGMEIGKSHRIVIRPADELRVKRRGQDIVVELPVSMTIGDQHVSKAITDVVRAALRVEAKSYLPKRLDYLATKHGFSYQKVRFSHAGGRWGSCSSRGTISLNIALMKLPFELIDYVLLHELAHTAEMNHSPKFWDLVEQADSNFRQHRKQLKEQTPSI